MLQSLRVGVVEERGFLASDSNLLPLRVHSGPSISLEISQYVQSFVDDNRELKRENISLQKQIRKVVKRAYYLETLVDNNAPHRRLYRSSLAIFFFLTICLLADSVLSVTIIAPLWNKVFMVFAFGFWLMSIALEQDYRTLLQNRLMQKRSVTDNS